MRFKLKHLHPLHSPFFHSRFIIPQSSSFLVVLYTCVCVRGEKNLHQILEANKRFQLFFSSAFNSWRSTFFHLSIELVEIRFVWLIVFSGSNGSSNSITTKNFSIPFAFTSRPWICVCVQMHNCGRSLLASWYSRFAFVKWRKIEIELTFRCCRKIKRMHQQQQQQ